MDKKNFNLEEKDIYKLFNEVKIEESEFKETNETVSDIERKRIKKNLNKRIKNQTSIKVLKKGAMAAAIGLACFVGVGIASPTFAKEIPVLNSIIQMFENKNGNYGECVKYSQIVNKGVADKGITITINEVLADESKLIISYTIKSDRKIKDLNVFALNSFLKINGKQFYGSGSGAGKYIDDFTYIASDQFDLYSFKLPKKFNISLSIDDIVGIKGKWNFKFSASKEEICKNTTIFKPNKKAEFPNSTVNIDKVEFSPIGTYILLSGNYKNKRDTATPSSLFDYDYWIAYDDKGIELTPIGIGAGKADSSSFNSEMNYGKIESIPKYLTILPCKIIPSGAGGVSMDASTGKERKITNIKTKQPKEIGKSINSKYPMELSQGKMGKITIKEVKAENNKTVVKLIAEGKAPYFQASSVHIKDQSGEYVTPINNDIRKDYNKPNEFTLEFEALNPNKKYTIFTTDFSNVEVREDLKFNIEFK